MSKVTFQKLVSIYRNVSFEANAKEGVLTLSNEELRNTLTELLEEDNLDDSGLSLVSGDPNNILTGQTVRLHISSPRIGIGILAENLNELLGTNKSCIEERKNYFLIDDKFAKQDLQVPDGIKLYRELLEFIQLLKSAAAYLEFEREELIFINEGKFSIPIKYSYDDLLVADFEAIKKIEASFFNDLHKEQKLAILADALIALTKGAPPLERFNRLLTHLPELLSKFSDGYRFFVSNFSYDKVRSELEATQVEYTAKIHKVFTDIQNQLLTIPVATIVVATQMKQATGLDQFWINTAVLIGSFIFVILVGFLIWNQKHTLDTLAQEITRQKILIGKEYQAVASNFDDIFTRLNDRLCLQKRILLVICLVLFSGFVLAITVYFILTPVVWGYFTSCYYSIIALFETALWHSIWKAEVQAFHYASSGGLVHFLVFLEL